MSLKLELFHPWRHQPQAHMNAILFLLPVLLQAQHLIKIMDDLPHLSQIFDLLPPVHLRLQLP